MDESRQVNMMPQNPVPAAGAVQSKPADASAASQWETARREIRAEREAYERNKPKILAQYEGQFVAVLGGEVIDHDTDYWALASRVYARLGRRTVLLTRATSQADCSVVSLGIARMLGR